MARKATSKLQYRWSNGSYHSRKQTTTGGIVGGGPQNLGRGNLAQGLRPPRPGATYRPEPIGGPAMATLSPIKAKTPAAPVAPPPDPAQIAATVTANRNLGIADADTTYQTGQIKQAYGYDDLSNPFSRAALLKESYDKQQLGTTSNFAGQNQYNSGAYGGARTGDRHQYAIADDATRREYADALHGVSRNKLQAYADYGTSISAADWDALINAYKGG